MLMTKGIVIHHEDYEEFCCGNCGSYMDRDEDVCVCCFALNDFSDPEHQQHSKELIEQLSTKQRKYFEGRKVPTKQH